MRGRRGAGSRRRRGSPGRTARRGRARRRAGGPPRPAAPAASTTSSASTRRPPARTPVTRPSSSTSGSTSVLEAHVGAGLGGGVDQRRVEPPPRPHRAVAGKRPPCAGSTAARATRLPAIIRRPSMRWAPSSGIFKLVQRRHGTRRQAVAAHLVAPVRALLEHDRRGHRRGRRGSRPPHRPARRRSRRCRSARSSPQIQSGHRLLGDALVMVDHLGDDEAQELLGEHRVEPRLDRERPQPGDLLLLAYRIGGGSPTAAL